MTAAARAGTGRAQVGTEGWRRSNRRMERKRQSSGCRHVADGTQRGDFWGRLPALPLPTRCRECRKRKRAAARYRADCRCVPGLIIVRARSVTGEAIALLGSAESAGGDEGSEALVEGGGADAAARAQLGEWQRAADVSVGRTATVDRTAGTSGIAGVQGPPGRLGVRPEQASIEAPALLCRRRNPRGLSRPCRDEAPSLCVDFNVVTRVPAHWLRDPSRP